MYLDDGFLERNLRILTAALVFILVERLELGFFIDSENVSWCSRQKLDSGRKGNKKVVEDERRR